MKTVCPSCRRIPKKIRSKRAIHAVRTRTKYIIAKTQPWCNYKTFKFSQHTKKSTRVSPSACALPDAAHAKRALFPPKLAFGKEVGEACRSRPRKIPHKSPALPDFYTSARAAAARPRPPCGREGGITPGFSGTGGVSRGDSVPPGHFNAPTASCHYPAPHRTPHGTARADPAHPACRASRPTGRARSFRARA